MTDQTADVAPVKWQDAMKVFANEGLAPPPALSLWPEDVRQIGSGIYGNWVPDAALHDFEALLREMFETAPDGAVVFGMDGHGVQSWAAHMALRSGALLIGIQISASGIYHDQDAAAERLAGAWDMLAALLEEVDRSDAHEHDLGRTLVVFDTDATEERWAWVDAGQSWDRVEWHVETPAAFLGLMQLRARVTDG